MSTWDLMIICHHHLQSLVLLVKVHKRENMGSISKCCFHNLFTVPIYSHTTYTSEWSWSYKLYTLFQNGIDICTVQLVTIIMHQATVLQCQPHFNQTHDTLTRFVKQEWTDLNLVPQKDDHSLQLLHNLHSLYLQGTHSIQNDFRVYTHSHRQRDPDQFSLVP